MNIQDLDLDIIGEPRFVRELTAEDVAQREEPPAAPANNRLRKIRDTHHALARALAGGLSEGEASAATGYSVVTISILKTDPAFQELLAHYRGVATGAWADMHARMTSFATDIIDELRDRFDANPENMSDAYLQGLLRDFNDRTGYGVKTTQVNVNVELASRLEAARKRAGLTAEGFSPASASEAGKIIEGELVK